MPSPIHTIRTDDNGKYIYQVIFTRKIVFVKGNIGTLITKLTQFANADSRQDALNKIRNLKRLESSSKKRVTYTFSLDTVKRIRTRKTTGK